MDWEQLREKAMTNSECARTMDPMALERLASGRKAK